MAADGFGIYDWQKPIFANRKNNSIDGKVCTDIQTKLRLKLEKSYDEVDQEIDIFSCSTKFQIYYLEFMIIGNSFGTENSSL